MPPKPKGLKASKRAAPFDPSTGSDAASATASTSAAGAGPALNKDKTMPLDEDALTVLDLFELRHRVLEILYPYPTSLRYDFGGDPDRLEDARNLLRGILHGCDMLEPFLSEPRRQEMDQDKLDALGLGDQGPAGRHLRYLQAFSLRILGEFFEPATVAVPVAGTKKRKVDLREPQTAKEWFETADGRLSSDDGVNDDADRIFSAVVAAEQAHLHAVSSASASIEALPDLASRVTTLLDHLESFGAKDEQESNATSLDSDDAFYAAYRAITASLVALEAHRDPSRLCDSETLQVALCTVVLGERPSGPEGLMRWLSEVVRADAELAQFGIAEDWIEDKYRASAEDEEADEDDEVQPLPEESKEDVAKVAEMGEKGETARAAAHRTIASDI